MHLWGQIKQSVDLSVYFVAAIIQYSRIQVSNSQFLREYAVNHPETQYPASVSMIKPEIQPPRLQKKPDVTSRNVNMESGKSLILRSLQPHGQIPRRIHQYHLKTPALKRKSEWGYLGEVSGPLALNWPEMPGFQASWKLIRHFSFATPLVGSPQLPSYSVSFF